MNRYETAIPGAQVGLHKRTNKADITYGEFVTRYAWRQAFFTFGIVFGIFVAVGAIVLIHGTAVLWLVALGAAVSAAGAAGFIFNWSAHNEYLDGGYGVTTTETYQPRPVAPPPTVRPFVASANSGKTTNTGRLNFEPRIWQNLFDLALGNGGVIDGNVARRSGIGNRWYHTDYQRDGGYRALLAELRALKFIDDRNRLTPAALQWYEQQIALPLSKIGINRESIDTGDDSDDSGAGAGGSE